jgi:surface protein
MVNDMESMFSSASSFNQDISGWNVGNVTTMRGMFSEASAFNQPIGNWNVINVTKMDFMFNKATAFNQQIGNWDVSNVTNMVAIMQSKTSANYSAANLDAIYNGWSSRPVKPSVTANFGSIKYTAASQAGRNILTGAPNNWAITDGGI